MELEPGTLLALILLVGFGAYVQTVTGFAMGLIVMGANSLFDLTPIGFAAIVVSLTSLFNIALVLHRHHRHVERRTLLWASVGLAPALIAGVVLLDHLSQESGQLLRQLLGAFILVGGVILMLKPQPRHVAKGRGGDLLYGALGGFFGGLFSTAGPPLVYHLYRQPFSIEVIRATLLAIFGVITLLRNGYVMARGELDTTLLLVTALCLPLISLATVAGHRFAPPLGAQGMRRLAFAILALIGITLLVS
jgi:uncharacterized membrane protein YfcA